MDMKYLLGLALPLLAAHVPHPGSVYALSKPIERKNALPKVGLPPASNPKESMDSFGFDAGGKPTFGKAFFRSIGLLRA